MKLSTLILTLLLGLSAQCADTPKPLDNPGRLLVRDAQLSLSQAHIQRLQGEVAVRDAEAALIRLLQTLKTQYACPDCQLNNDFTWTAPAPPAKAESGNQTPAPPKAPPKAGGQSSQKE